jgi:cell wall-associated NlpC family hydrolase
LGAASVGYSYGHPELGQTPETGFYCSGFVRYVLLQAGLTIPDYIGMDGQRRPIHHASEFWDHYGVAVHERVRLPGDLVFFTKRGQMPRHIGFVFDEERYIHAPGHDGTQVRIEPIADYPPIETPPRTPGRGVLYDHNPIGYKSPAVMVPSPTYRYHQQPV